MNRYTIYCTEEQTKKAFELGAPIIEMPFKYKMPPDICTKYGFINLNSTYYVMPTAEQMIGWLRSQGICVSVLEHKLDGSVYYTRHMSDRDYSCESFPTYEEAMLTVINEALKCLTNNK